MVGKEAGEWGGENGNAASAGEEICSRVKYLYKRPKEGDRGCDDIKSGYHGQSKQRRSKERGR